MKESAQTTRFRDRFDARHVVLPVIHVETQRQAADNARLAMESGADGVFLINHRIPYRELLDIHTSISEAFRGAWLGVNCLDLSPAEVFRKIPSSVGGVWVDNAMIQETESEQPEAQRVLEAREESGSHALYFGGVAFKYQRPVDDLAAAAKRASRFMDVVTTSGPGTGQAAHVEKISKMKEAIGPFPLAIASGITPDNVEQYLPHSDCYLVATGISRSFTQLDPSLLKELLDRVRDSDSK